MIQRSNLSLAGGAWLLAAGLSLLGGCGAAPTVSLQLSGNVRDALVTVDDQPLGPLSYVQKRGVALPVGEHRITVEKAGYFPFDLLVVAKDGAESVAVEAKLTPIPD